MDLNYFRAIHNSLGATERKEALVQQEKQNLSFMLRESINYETKCTRNGVQQNFIIKPNDVRYKCDIEAMPDEELRAGDVIGWRGFYYVVIETVVSSAIQVRGIMWLCNHCFKFQNNTSDMIERWGVLDSGVYSTTKTSDTVVEVPAKQFKIYLPLDEDTRKIYVDKRIAAGTTFNAYGEEILDVFEITGRNSIARSYGDGHLLVLECKSGSYDADKDNFELEICNYITPEPVPTPPPVPPVPPVPPIVVPTLVCAIQGGSTIRRGTSRKFAPVFYEADGVTVSVGIVPIWEPIISEYVEMAEDGDSIIITTSGEDSAIGTAFTIGLSADGYIPITKEVEVV